MKSIKSYAKSSIFLFAYACTIASVGTEAASVSGRGDPKDTGGAQRSDNIQRHNLTSFQGKWLGHANIKQYVGHSVVGTVQLYVCSAGNGSIYVGRRIIRLNNGAIISDNTLLFEPSDDEGISIKNYPSRNYIVMRRKNSGWSSTFPAEGAIPELHKLDLRENEWNESWVELVGGIKNEFQIELKRQPEDAAWADTWAQAVSSPEPRHPICD